MEHVTLPEGTKHFIFAPYEAPEEECCGWRFVTTEDFLKPKGEQKARIIDTSNLPTLLVQWRKGLEEAEDPTVYKVFSTWEKLEQKFDRVKTILNRFCLPDEKNKSPPYWPVRDEISTTIIALACSLRQAAVEACSGKEEDHAGTWPGACSKILAKRIEHKWCLAETRTALKDLSIDGHYYIAASPSPGPEYLDRHYNCLPDRCLNNIDEGLYYTRHADASWHDQDCKTAVEYGGHLASDLAGNGWVDSVCKIIDKGAIPLALWKKEARQLWSSEDHVSEQDISNSPYVAISHVWADGMGNPNANWLPECQLDRITHLIENIRWKSGEPSAKGEVCFWMDTLCVPVQPENKARRKQAIASMRDIYATARSVLVLDSWLQQIPSTAPMLTIITRLYQSSWLKRLWTHQEGFLPSAVYIQFSDHAIELEDLRVKFDECDERLQATGIYLRCPIKMNEKLFTDYGLYKDLISDKDRNDEDKWLAYIAVASSMYYRQTSRLADETICLATLLGTDLEPLLSIPDKPDAEAAKQRMVVFLQQLKTLDAPLIFNNYERLNVPGFQWAPKSLLNFRSADTGIYDGDGNMTLQEMNGE